MPKIDITIDEAVAAVLAGDIRALVAERQEIDAEMAKLAARRRAVEWKINTFASASETLNQPVADSVGPGLNGAPVPPGFRVLLRHVLAQAKGGLRPKEVADAVLETGYLYSGQTPFGVRVTKELHKLKEKGDVNSRDGLYFLNPSSDMFNSGNSR